MKAKLAIATLLMSAGTAASAQTVTLDYYFNHEVHKNKAGQQERFHYLWGEKQNTGFSIFGASFTTAGAQLDSLDQAPTADNLKNTAIYIIVGICSISVITYIPHYNFTVSILLSKKQFTVYYFYPFNVLNINSLIKLN